MLDRRNLFAVTCYAVERSISVGIFEALVVSLQTQAKASVTKENAASLPFFGTVVGVLVRSSLDSSGTSSAEKSVSKVEIAMKRVFQKGVVEKAKRVYNRQMGGAGGVKLRDLRTQ
jgi:hypothetical protein